MSHTPKDDLPSYIQEYLDYLAARTQQVTADYLELEEEKQVILSQPQPPQEQLQSLLLRLEHHNEQLRNLQEQVNQAIEDLRQWQMQHEEKM
jgi:FtsZ-binding cell division protein ZapB